MLKSSKARLHHHSAAVSNSLATAAASNGQAAATVSVSRFGKLLDKLKTLKGIVVAIAGVGAVASGLVGYYTTYKTVANTQLTAPAAASVLKPDINSKSIAVLPFVNMSSDKDQEYFSDGISEELLNQLSKIHELRVIARTSSFSFKGKGVDVASIAKTLNVSHILEGSIRKSGNKIRITAQLIRAADSSHLWSETYERDFSDIFAVQDEISAAVVSQLKIQILGAAPKAKAVDPKSYALYLQARHFSLQGTATAYAQAIALCQQALVIEPNYAEVWSELGWLYLRQSGVSLRPTTEGVQLAHAAIKQALLLAPELASAHATLGWIAMLNDGDLAAAAQHFKRALNLAPEDAEVLRGAASLMKYLGRLEPAIVIGEVAIAQDPLSRIAYSYQGHSYRYAKRSDAAIASYRMALSLSPGHIGAHYHIGLLLLDKGQPQEALEEMQQEFAGSVYAKVGLPMVWHQLGEKAKERAALAELIREQEKESAFQIAYVQAYLGDADAAFVWLDKAVLFRDSGLAALPVEWMFTNIHKDKRWLPFLRKLGKAPEQLAAIKFEVKLPGR